jgi:Pectate lyase superfamily protein
MSRDARRVQQALEQVANGSMSRRELASVFLGGTGAVTLLTGYAIENEDEPNGDTAVVQGFDGVDIKWVETSLGGSPWPVCNRTGDLASKSAGILHATVVIAKGCLTAGDRGGGLFYWDASSTETDNGGTVIQPHTIDPTCLPGSSPGRWIRIYDGPIDVRWFGARGDGDDTKDDTKAIQAALDEVSTKGGTLTFPSGRYIIKSPGLNAKDAWGVRYQGASTSTRATNFDEELQIKQFPTVLVWRGASSPTDILFQWSGSSCTFDGLVFQGGWDSDPTPPGIGFLLKKTGGIGSGKGYFPRVQFTHCVVGFQCSDDENDCPSCIPPGVGNCDILTFGKFGVANCGTGFRVLNAQGTSYVFEDTKFDDTGICFDFKRGGPLIVNNMFCVNTGVLLQVQHGGTGNSGYRIGFIKFDKQQSSRVVWVKHTVDPATPGLDLANITIEGASTAQAAGQGNSAEAAFQLGSRANLVVRNVNGGMVNSPNSEVGPSKLFKITGASGGRMATAVFENCSIDDLDPDAHQIGDITGTGTARRWLLRDCYRTPVNLRVPAVGNLPGAKRVGTTSFASRSFTKTVTHNIAGTVSGLGDGVVPRILITPKAGELMWVTSVTASQFTVARTSPAPATTPSFDWCAEVIV